MAEGFFKLRTPEQIERDAEEFASRDPRLPVEIACDEENAALIRAEVTDPAAARILQVARIIDPGAWDSRANFLDMIERERKSRRANETTGRAVIASFERSAISAVATGIRKAREIIDLLA